jgi:hypothetical protein
VTVFMAGLFPLLMLGRRHLSAPQLILVLGFLAAVLGGAVMPFLLWNHGMKGPKAIRTCLFFGLMALADLVLAVMAAWVVASAR